MENHETEVEIEHDEIDKISDCAVRKECPKPVTPDWRHGTTEAMDVDYQKAFDNIVEDSTLMLISDDDDATSDHCFGKLGFLSSCLGYAVFLCNIWRYLYYRNDSGISLISNVPILFFSGILLFIMEFGQFSSKIVPCVWKFNSLHQEILLGMFISSSLVTLDYNTLIVWSFISMFALMNGKFHVKDFIAILICQYAVFLTDLR